MQNGLDISSLLNGIAGLQGNPAGAMAGGGTATPASPTYQKLGAAVAAAREQRGLSQAQLGQAIGKSPSTVAGIEAGTNRILVSDVEDIAKALGVEPAMLMKGIWF